MPFFLPLDGVWTLRAPERDLELPAEVPGCVHADLLRAGLIPDPDLGTQELELQWIGRMPWVYERHFELPVEFLEQEHLRLRAEGLDTLATLEINGTVLAHTDNMHRTWEFPAKGLLRPGTNHLRVTFAPTFPYLEEKAKIDPLPAWNEYLGCKHRGWLRKQHSNYGWDWAPVLVSCGIWRSISLLAWSGARLDGVRVDQHHSRQRVDLDIHVDLDTAEAWAGGTIEAWLSLDGQEVAHAVAPLPKARGTCPLAVRKPRLWWPAGLGDPTLYDLRVEVRGADGTEPGAWSGRIGLRTLRLVRQPDAHGESFHFEANGVPFFAKGSNWCNPLPYPSWPAESHWEPRLRDAAAANLNMIRVWGGAYFPPDAFFDRCDELGLTIWQDLLFACGPYPFYDDAFLDNIAAETRDNVRRLRHHACIALWCGNNELEPAFTAPERAGMKMAWADYDRAFNQRLPEVIATEDPQGNYWPASPTATNAERTNTDPTKGDIHIWEIWFSDAPFENYRNYPHRFISEFGFQSMPHPATVRGFADAIDLQLNSPVLEHHQRSGPGNVQMLKHLLTWFRFPASFDEQCHLTQLVQALCVKTGVEHWRRNMPRTMGALYWQLNDCWPCPSWSSIDFEGRWKALHHFARRFFAPTLVSGLEDAAAGTVAVHVSHDGRERFTGRLHLTVTDLEGTVLDTQEKAVRVAAGSSQCVLTQRLGERMQDPGPDALLVWLELHDGEGREVSRNLVHFSRPKRFDLPDAELQAKVKQLDRGRFEITLRAQRPALWVRLEAEPLRVFWSDNHSSVRPGTAWVVTAETDPKTSLAQFQRALRVTDLRGSYASKA